jgi:SAM-dependent methyltransferase
MQQAFFQAVLDLVQRDDRVLDLGAGSGHQAASLARAGASVTAVDVKPAGSALEFVTWEQSDVMEFIASLPLDTIFDLILLNNVLQFLPRDATLNTLIPRLKHAVRGGGIIALRTFFQQPDPPFSRDVPSLYTMSDLTAAFVDWETIHALQERHQGPDMRGVPRHFSIISLIVRRPRVASSGGGRIVHAGSMPTSSILE